ncbi:ABC transporter ATP-binding protein [Chloroflexus sp.]|uniref:ABC transporter ATP-binding protein n=1 Tax=Chloroflexus sp. TaxID=1904827 RepID=UPI003A100A81
MATLEIRAIRKTFPTPTGPVVVLDGLNMQVAAGEFVAVIGPSGSGKTTLFNIIAGLEPPDAGAVVIDGNDVTGCRGQVAYMPQRDALLPWLSVVENAVLATVVQGGDVAAARREARALLADFGLQGWGDARPAMLSGGMRQRAAFLRTVLWHRPVMLLDEPFGALDALTRAQLQQWLLSLWDRLDRTVLLVTHDIDEAIILADRIYVLTPRPARIALEVQVELPRPRSYALVTDQAFARLKRQLQTVLMAGERYV